MCKASLSLAVLWELRGILTNGKIWEGYVESKVKESWLMTIGRQLAAANKTLHKKALSHWIQKSVPINNAANSRGNSEACVIAM